MDRAEQQQIGLLVLRMALGLIFFLHGWMNVLGGQESFIREMLAMAGWSAPDLVVWLLTGLELLGGLALILGLFAREAALILAVEMVVAVGLFHAREGFLIIAIPNVPLAYAFEYPLALVGGLVCSALAGPGMFALQDRIRSRRDQSSAESPSPTG